MRNAPGTAPGHFLAGYLEETVASQPILGDGVGIQSFVFNFPVELEEHVGRDLRRDRVDQARQVASVLISDGKVEDGNNVFCANQDLVVLQRHETLLNDDRLGGKKKTDVDFAVFESGNAGCSLLDALKFELAPMPWRWGWGSTWVMSTPSISIVPEVASTSRLIIFRVVVLPHPDGPTSTTISPSLMSRLSSLTAGLVWLGKVLETPRRRIMGSDMPGAYYAHDSCFRAKGRLSRGRSSRR